MAVRMSTARMRTARTGRTVGRPLALILAVALAAATVACAPPPPPPPDPSSTTITVGGESVVVTGPAGSTVTAAAADTGALPPLPDGLEFPLGAVDITVADVEPGAVVSVRVQLQTPVETVRKLIAGVWDPFAPDGTTGATLSSDGRTITLLLVDGGRGDSDGVADGTIHDPLAPANLTAATPTGCYRSAVGPDLKVVGPPNSNSNIRTYLSSFDGTCSGAPRPTLQEYAFLVTAPSLAAAVGTSSNPGKCTAVWNVPGEFVGLALSFVTGWGYAGPDAGTYFVCLGPPPT